MKPDAAVSNQPPVINHGVIDIGTNSTRLLVFRTDLETGAMVRVNKSVRYTRMGQDLGRTGRLHPDAMKRNLDALAEYQAIAADYAVDELYIFGTSAMRDAENTGDFIQMAKDRLGLDIEVVSGQKEAEYGFLGVSRCYDEPVLIFDIGGGSTELILGCGAQLEKMVSLNIGCVRLTEGCIENDPPLKAELAALSKAAAIQLHSVMPDFMTAAPFTLVGIGGTATTISTIDQGLKIYDSDKVHQSRVTKEALEGIITRLAALPLEERRQIAGLEAKRADIIIAGACILEEILKEAGAGDFAVCDFDNLEGAAFSRWG